MFFTHEALCFPTLSDPHSRRSPAQIVDAVQFTLEALEQRRFLTTMTVSGTSSGEIITVQHQGSDYVARINTVVVQTVAAATVTALVVNAGDGADTVSVGGIDVATTVNGEEGDDDLGYSDVHNSATTLNGGEGDDTFTTNVPVYVDGGSDDDTLDGHNANDGATLHGGDGSDSILGGAGHDSITGGDAADYIEGRAGNDTFDGGSGDDTLVGGNGNDSMIGGSGADLADYSYVTTGTNDLNLSLDGVANDTNSVTGETDNLDTSIEHITGGAGDDTLVGSSAGNMLIGGTGNDSIAGSSGNDTMTGGDGADTLSGSSGSDSLDGGVGSDLVDGDGDIDTLIGDAGTDTLSGDSGNGDVIDYSSRTADLRIDLDGVADDGEIAGSENDNVFADFEVILCGSGNDQVVGDQTLDDPETVNGGDGNDNLQLVGGADSILGGAGADTLRGGNGNDTLVGGTGVDTMNGDNDNDLLNGADGSGSDTLNGAAGTDTNGGSDGGDVLQNLEA